MPFSTSPSLSLSDVFSHSLTLSFSQKLNGVSILAGAVFKDFREVCRWLLSEGADVDFPSDNGQVRRRVVRFSLSFFHSFPADAAELGCI